MPALRPAHRGRGRLSVGMVGVLLALAGCSTGPADTRSPPGPTPSTAAPASPSPTAAPTSAAPPSQDADESALAGLETLTVRGRAAETGYDRAQYGQAWLDTDRNGCDTRNDILRRDLSETVVRAGTNGCLVESGLLHDPYTGGDLDFVRGPGDIVDIDHVVALQNSWVSGAHAWDIRQRAALANDPMNLLAVDASANRQKGDGDAATWLPSSKSYRCAYVARQVGVKLKYGLSVTPAEHDAIGRVLARCPDQPLPADSGAPVLSPVAPNAPSAPATPSATPPAAGGGAAYDNCDAARAAGAAPVRRGQPGYAPHLDRDGDGIGCDS